MTRKRQNLEELARKVLEELDTDLYMLKWEKRGSDWILELIIQKDGPVTVSHCETISKKISDTLDASDLIDREYELRVSSPGVERPLVEPRHFRGAIDSQVQISTYGPVRGSKKLVGTLKAFSEERKTVELLVDGDRFAVPLSKVAKAETKADFQ